MIPVIPLFIRSSGESWAGRAGLGLSPNSGDDALLSTSVFSYSNGENHLADFLKLCIVFISVPATYKVLNKCC